MNARESITIFSTFVFWVTVGY